MNVTDHIFARFRTTRMQLFAADSDESVFEADFAFGVNSFTDLLELRCLLDVLLEPDTVVQGCIYLAHRRENIYPDPEQFRPERFLERPYSPFEYLPFGGGARRCIGIAFAQFEMKLVISQLLSNFELA